MKNTRQFRFSCSIILVFISFFLFFIFRLSLEHSSADIKYVKIAGQSIKVDLALTQEKQERGLSGRSSLKEDEGMLFVFKQSRQYDFWMKDMNFPIDMIWVGEDMRVVYIKKNALPELYPEVYGPTEDAKYVLEINSGFSEKNNLKVGDGVQFSS